MASNVDGTLLDVVGLVLAATSGVFAAGSSVFGKLGVTVDEDSEANTQDVAISKLLEISVETPFGTIEAPQTASALRLICFLCFLLCNFFMWLTFAKALARSKSSLAPMAVNTGFNFASSGLFGMMFFGENVNLMWWCGMSLIVTGVTIIAHEAQGSEPDSDDKTKKKKQ
eukprot:m.106965 g.106965  ORF g.106965 m.106965 type:complete len:170 (-) comp13906_c0_seq2:1452-1961(-)